MKKNTIFLLRAYNDIDHIVPVIWKVSSSGWPTYIYFVDKDYSDDYRIKFVLSQGARLLKSTFLGCYHDRLRRFIVPRYFRRSIDRAVAFSVGFCIIIRYRIQVAVNEWSGPYGREQAEYILRPAKFLRVPIYSLPHGYSIYKNRIFNRHIKDHYRNHGCLPDFSNRNWFTRYIVQSSEHKAANVEQGLDCSKILVLGSTRFCKEWSGINLRLLSGDVSSLRDQLFEKSLFKVVFFLTHWDYNVDRERCIDLLLKIAGLPDLDLIIKAHTRGSGALSLTEREQLQKKPNVSFADDSLHSTVLIQIADLVINFGSSIGFEALRQRRLVVNPSYLHDNNTVFDKSGAVIDTRDETSTLERIVDVQLKKSSTPDQSMVNQFLVQRVDGGSMNQDVLQNYLDVLSGITHHSSD